VASLANTTAQFFTLLSDSGDFLGGGLGFRIASRHKLLERFTRLLRFDSIPTICQDNAEGLIGFLRLLDKYAYHSGYINVFMGSYASRDVSRELSNLSFDLSHRLEFVLRIDRSDDDLWEGFEYKRRKNINKAKRIGVTVQDLSPEEGIPMLLQLQAESGHRILARGGPDVTYKGHPLDHPIRKLMKSGLARIVGAKVNGTFVSASLFTCFNGLVYHTVSGHSKAALETQAPTFLLWESIRRYRNEGAKIFNFGGCKAEAANDDSPEHGVYIYKKAFGGEEVKCSSGSKIMRKNMHNLINGVKSILRF
jgi:hypothetical protein